MLLVKMYSASLVFVTKSTLTVDDVRKCQLFPIEVSVVRSQSSHSGKKSHRLYQCDGIQKSSLVMFFKLSVYDHYTSS